MKGKVVVRVVMAESGGVGRRTGQTSTFAEVVVVVVASAQGPPTPQCLHYALAGHGWTSGGQSATFEYCHIWLALVFSWSLLHLFMYYNLLKV